MSDELKKELMILLKDRVYGADLMLEDVQEEVAQMLIEFFSDRA